MEWAAAEGAASLPDEPEIDLHVESVWRAFHTLSPLRGFSSVGSPLPLTFDAISQWADRFGPHDPDEFENFLHLMTALDTAWFEIRRQETPREGS